MFWQTFKECLQITFLSNFCRRNLCHEDQNLCYALNWWSHCSIVFGGKPLNIICLINTFPSHWFNISRTTSHTWSIWMNSLHPASYVFGPPINILLDPFFALFHCYCIREAPVGSPGVKWKVVIKLMSLNSRTYRYLHVFRKVACHHFEWDPSPESCLIWHQLHFQEHVQAWLPTHIF